MKDKAIEIYDSNLHWPHGVLDELSLDKVDLYLSTLYLVARYFFEDVQMEINRIDKTFQMKIFEMDITWFDITWFSNFHKLLNAYFKLYSKKDEEEIIREASIANADVDDESDDDYYNWHQTYNHLSDIKSWDDPKNTFMLPIPKYIIGKDKEKEVIDKLLDWMM